MQKLRVAVATDDGRNFVKRHFGDADYYDVYEVSAAEAVHIMRLTNNTEEEDEEAHADPKKARGVAALLRKQGVHVALTRVFGPNIKRIKSKFVCILTSHEDIVPGLAMVRSEFPVMVAEWEKGAERGFLDWRKGTG